MLNSPLEMTALSFLSLTIVFLFCVSLFGICLFAFLAPKDFVEWLSPLNWLLEKLPGNSSKGLQRYASYSLGMLFLLALLFGQFVMGGMLATVAFELWNSPFALVLYPY